jgi:hypothetical protein
VIIALAGLAAAAPAHANVGSSIGKDTLALSEVRRQISVARTTVPQAFAAVEGVWAEVAIAQPPRDRRAMITRSFRALGTDGLMPLLALIDDPHTDLEPQARESLVVGAIEAVGRLRDRRSVPMLDRVLSATDERPLIIRAAAEAVGSLCTDEDISRLLVLAGPGQRFEREGLSGLRGCRREAAARHLWDRLSSRPSAEVTIEVAEAIGYQASSWAWHAIGPARAAEGKALRTVAQQALLAARPTATGKALEAIDTALEMIGTP